MSSCEWGRMVLLLLSLPHYFLPSRCAASDQNSVPTVQHVNPTRLNRSIMRSFLSICSPWFLDWTLKPSPLLLKSYSFAVSHNLRKAAFCSPGLKFLVCSPAGSVQASCMASWSVSRLPSTRHIDQSLKNTRWHRRGRNAPRKAPFLCFVKILSLNHKPFCTLLSVLLC